MQSLYVIGPILLMISNGPIYPTNSLEEIPSFKELFLGLTILVGSGSANHRFPKALLVGIQFRPKVSHGVANKAPKTSTF